MTIFIFKKIISVLGVSLFCSNLLLANNNTLDNNISIVGHKISLGACEKIDSANEIIKKNKNSFIKLHIKEENNKFVVATNCLEELNLHHTIAYLKTNKIDFNILKTSCLIDKNLENNIIKEEINTINSIDKLKFKNFVPINTNNLKKQPLVENKIEQNTKVVNSTKIENKKITIADLMKEQSLTISKKIKKNYTNEDLEKLYAKFKMMLEQNKHFFAIPIIEFHQNKEINKILLLLKTIESSLSDLTIEEKNYLSFLMGWHNLDEYFLFLYNKDFALFSEEQYAFFIKGLLNNKENKKINIDNHLSNLYFMDLKAYIVFELFNKGEEKKAEVFIENYYNENKTNINVVFYYLEIKSHRKKLSQIEKEQIINDIVKDKNIDMTWTNKTGIFFIHD